MAELYGVDRIEKELRKRAVDPELRKERARLNRLDRDNLLLEDQGIPYGVRYDIIDTLDKEKLSLDAWIMTNPSYREGRGIGKKTLIKLDKIYEERASVHYGLMEL